MRKKYASLTPDQKARGVIFSSELVGGGTIHEVFKGDERQAETIRRLKDDSFLTQARINII